MINIIGISFVFKQIKIVTVFYKLFYEIIVLDSRLVLISLKEAFGVETLGSNALLCSKIIKNYKTEILVGNPGSVKSIGKL